MDKIKLWILIIVSVIALIVDIVVSLEQESWIVFAEYIILFFFLFSFPLILTIKYGWGKGLFLGAIIATIVNTLDFYIKTSSDFYRWYVECGQFCGIDNAYFYGFCGFLFIIGAISLVISYFRNR
ncbi:MAG: hypothetical protein AABX16_03885 [Nanoarchaeota archaeon]